MTVGLLAGACERAGVDFHPTAGVGGGPVASPTTEDALCALVAAFASDPALAGARLVPLGRGRQLGWCRPDAVAAPQDTLQVTMRSLLGDASSTGVVEYVPGDGTLTALAGADMAELRAVVAEGGHRLTPAIAEGATLGGVLASGRSGLDRHSLGPTRHHVLGMRMIDGSGRSLRSGGRLVKNVTGFDLHRLHVGARGIFGPIVEASLRLMPAPEEEQYLTTEPLGSTAEAVGLALELRRAPRVREHALFVRDRVVHVLLSGRGAQVAADRLRVEALLGKVHEHDPGPGAMTFHRAGMRDVAARVATVPSRVEGAVARLEAALGPLDQAVVEPGDAVIDLPAELLGTAAAWPEGLDASIEVRAPHGAALASDEPTNSGPMGTWTRRLIEAYDPVGLFQTDGFPASA